MQLMSDEHLGELMQYSRIDIMVLLFEKRNRAVRRCGAVKVGGEWLHEVQLGM